MRIQSMTFYFPLKLEHAVSNSRYLEFTSPYEALGFLCLNASFSRSIQSSNLLEHPANNNKIIK
jgi:hypothetical protein